MSGTCRAASSASTLAKARAGPARARAEARSGSTTARSDSSPCSASARANAWPLSPAPIRATRFSRDRGHVGGRGESQVVPCPTLSRSTGAAQPRGNSACTRPHGGREPRLPECGRHGGGAHATCRRRRHWKQIESLSSARCADRPAPAPAPARRRGSGRTGARRGRGARALPRADLVAAREPRALRFDRPGSRARGDRARCAARTRSPAPRGRAQPAAAARAPPRGAGRCWSRSCRASSERSPVEAGDAAAGLLEQHEERRDVPRPCRPWSNASSPQPDGDQHVLVEVAEAALACTWRAPAPGSARPKSPASSPARLPWKSCASESSRTPDTRMRRPFSNAPRPRAALQRVRSAGALTSPATISPSLLEREQRGEDRDAAHEVPRAVDRIDDQARAPGAGSPPSSSPNTPSPGWRRARLLAHLELDAPIGLGHRSQVGLRVDAQVGRAEPLERDRIGAIRELDQEGEGLGGIHVPILRYAQPRCARWRAAGGLADAQLRG